MPDANDQSGENIGPGNGKKGISLDIEFDTLNNTDFRRVLYTGEKLQLVLMRLKPGEEIGEEIHLSEKTIKNYVSTILRKLEVARRSEAAAYHSRAQAEESRRSE